MVIFANVKKIILFVVAVTVIIMCCGVEVRVPVNYTALTGDLEVHVQNLESSEQYYLQLLEYYYPTDNSFTIISSTPLKRDNVTEVVLKAKFPCGLISQGGQYGVRVQSHDDTDINEILIATSENAVKKINKNSIIQLDVRWPPVSLSIEPREIETYPEQIVTASVAFLKSYCEPSIGSIVPETWISLIYCGHSSIECKLDNISHMSQILYSEQVRGYPSLKYIPLNCNLFGQAGYYTLFLTSGMHGTGVLIATIPPSAMLKAKWSERFVFNVHTRSIFQCDAHGGGVAVLFQYPDCILSNDKIRLYGSLRADVASSLPPTSLHYITEQKIIKGKYSLHFDCDLFSEKYVEYCFVYVNQAITGAVSDVRMDCVPTFPISDKDAGQWGSWSEWSECSTTCVGGTRNRYRFCDSPSPKYGAKYCEGHPVETQPCGNSTSWQCQLYDVQIVPELLAEKPEIQEVVGEKCRCGCVIHLDATMPQRFLAASMRNCSRKTWWKIQADTEHTIQLYMNRVHFPCVTQKLKIHDGEFLSSNLLAQFTSTDVVSYKNFSVMSSGSVLLLEYSIFENLNHVDCAGGFLCHFRQKASTTVSNIGHVFAESMSGEMPVEAVHIAILIMLVVVVTMSLCMTIQYASRYRKYQRASVKDDFTDTEYSESLSKCDFNAAISHETSTSTLISEIIPLQKLRTRKEDADNDRSKPESTNSHSENEDVSDHAESSSCISHSKIKKQASSAVQHTFKADVHVEEKPEDNSQNHNSRGFTNEEPIHPSKKDSSERRPSVCTGISISSNISPTSTSLTNVVPSPNASLRGSTSKRVKDIRNQERMMVGSDLSLTGQDTDLEMDYYDYNVYNTSAVPGSYLGMDPAYCVWIPPFAPGRWVDNGKGGDSDDDEDERDLEEEEEEDDDDDANADNSCGTTSTDNIEMRRLDRTGRRTDSRSETPTSGEKFQRECKNKDKDKEKFKRNSAVSSASSSNRTVMPDDMTPDDDLTIQEALLPDTPVDVQKAIVVKDADQSTTDLSSFLERDDLKFADDDDDSEDAAYNSEDHDHGVDYDVVGVKKYDKPVVVGKRGTGASRRGKLVRSNDETR